MGVLDPLPPAAPHPVSHEGLPKLTAVDRDRFLAFVDGIYASPVVKEYSDRVPAPDGAKARTDNSRWEDTVCLARLLPLLPIQYLPEKNRIAAEYQYPPH